MILEQKLSKSAQDKMDEFRRPKIFSFIRVSKILTTPAIMWHQKGMTK
jgi:hypothetical protein